MQLKAMEKRIAEIKDQLSKIGEMRPGSINQQLTKCGKLGCACQDQNKPKKHGPYYQLSYVHQGKSTTQFIQKELLDTVESQIKNFKMYKLLNTEWVDLALAIAMEKLATDKHRLKNEAKKK